MATPLLLQPYASYVVAKMVAPLPGTTSRNSLRDVVESALRPKFGGARIDDVTPSIPSTPGLEFAITVQEQRPVAWAINPGRPNDVLNHLIVGFVRGAFAAIYVSDSELKRTVQDALVGHALTHYEPVDEKLLTQCYVASENIKTLWLGGAHRPVSVKPDSKVISGKQLEYALDPFADSTYVAGAVRSACAVGGIHRTVGVSMHRSSIWIGPTTNWSVFSAYAMHILHRLNTTTVKKGAGGIHGLAALLESFLGVGKGYIIEWADPDTSNGSARARRLTQLRAKYSMEVFAKSGLKAGEVCVNVIALTVAGTPTEQIILTPQLKGSTVSFSIPAATSPTHDIFVKQLRADSELIRVYYESGHSIASGKLALSAVQDRTFHFKFGDFSSAGPGVSYDVQQEKPPGNPVPFASIESPLDVSLFKWVYKEGLTLLGLGTPAPKKCWLCTDDGSGEVADFVLLDNHLPQAPMVTVFHVKGANCATALRRPSPGAYELVAAQAMKNLRRMQAGSLLDALQQRLTTKGTRRVWDQPWQTAAATSATASSDLLHALTALRKVPNTITYVVVIVQPHVLKSQYKADAKGAWPVAVQQLRALLSGAEAMARAASATLHVVADQR